MNIFLQNRILEILWFYSIIVDYNDQDNFSFQANAELKKSTDF